VLSSTASAVVNSRCAWRGSSRCSACRQRTTRSLSRYCRQLVAACAAGALGCCGAPDLAADLGQGVGEVAAHDLVVVEVWITELGQVRLPVVAGFALHRESSRPPGTRQHP
jgi:hypothetical protein